MKRCLLASALALLSVAAAACGSGGVVSLGPVDVSPRSPGATKTPVRQTPTASPIDQPTGPSATPTFPTTGTLITPSGSILQRTEGAQVKEAGPSTSCHTLIDAGWEGDCGRVQMAGGAVIWVSENQPVPDPCCGPWIVRIYRYYASAGGWVPDLAAEDLSGNTLSAAAVEEIDLTVDGKPELIGGFRFLGDGSILGYDIVTYGPGSTPQVAAHPDVSVYGGILITTGRIDEYRAEFPNDEPICCPAYFLHRVIRWDGSVFRATVLGREDHAVAQDWPPSPFAA